ncbi:hypothetical protein AGRA3207_002704 [Actinomadura graeca]|uniref:Tryptophan 2,3-dioxygenase n=1 Tax=Actinomadura graeca TaxID=2750812 RepID=A0ABX8QSJ2_9ACTN|nr:tryptophan 2,3-dioxygenase family protein [Actinomadura graeca]QXJ21805.1 hypothetical protein AGRA3207_002704 [Actinomadura graeca]
MSLRLPERCEHIIRIQCERGRAALTPQRLDELSRFYDEAAAAVCDGAESDTEAELLELLTRPFSRGSPIPRYYRYTNLHVYNWFLARYPDDPITGAAEALAVTLCDLLEVERRPPDGAIDPAVSMERRRRLRALLDRVYELTLDPAGDLALLAVLRRRRFDPRRRWNRFVLARCTDFPESDKHDEHLFLRSVHACEMIFFLVRSFVLRSAEVRASDVQEARVRLRQATLAATLLNEVFGVLWTMSPERFMGFRDETGDASAVQSMNYHAMEIVLYGLDPEKQLIFEQFDHLSGLRGILAEEWERLGGRVRSGDDQEIEHNFNELLQVLRQWRGRHYGFAIRYLTAERTGSGGTEGANYLKKFIEKASPSERSELQGVRAFLNC